PDLFDVFQKQNVGQEYVKHYCAPDQLDLSSAK
nr:hypothetical protein [Chlamydiota bacterium]